MYDRILSRDRVDAPGPSRRRLVGSPTVTAFDVRLELARNVSYTLSLTIAREHAEHFWPWKPNADAATPCAAASRSASSSTMMRPCRPSRRRRA
jgi:hypothetical protein